MKGDHLKYCILCNKYLKLVPQSFELHMRVHTNERPYNCKKCGKSYKSRSHLKSHKRVHGGPNRNVRFVTKCEICDKPMRCWSHLTVHMSSHTGEKPYKCEQCALRFARTADLKRHTICKHSDIKSYKCVSCPKTFATPLNLKNHVDRCHPTGERWKGRCKLCDKTFVSKHGLKKHLKSHVDKSKPSECNFCGMKFRTNSGRNRHIYVHTKENLKQCIFCEKQCIDMEIHLRTHTEEKPFHCSFCSSAFPNNSGLRVHLATHKKEKKFQCDICQKRFSLLQYLKIHSIVHSNDRRYKCNLCNRRFGNLRTLNMHIWKHTGEMPYKCQDCGKDFRSSTLLKIHRLGDHFDVASKEYNVFHILYCVFCQKVFLYKNECFLHIIRHIKEKPHSCKDCNVEFSNKPYLLRHIRAIHKKAKILK